MISDREILRRAYVRQQGESQLWEAAILKQPQYGHTAFIDVEVALTAMAMLRAVLANGSNSP